jgi:dTDP-glucose 4,6-dehydratase
MKILVTGGAGFIGTNFIRLVLGETSHSVINFDLLTYAGRRGNLAEFEGNGRYRFVKGDIADADAVQTALKGTGVDAVVNFAAESHVDRSIHSALEFIRTNVMGTQVLLDSARGAGIGRFLHVSTDEVYGDLQPDEPAFTEQSPLKPSSPYAASKTSADLLVLAAWRTHKYPAVITRCSNNYGPYQFPEKFIPLSIHRATHGEKIPVYGRGTNVRDWIHVEDHCRGVLAALERGKPGEVYNFGGNAERRNIDVVGSVLSMLGRGEELISFVTDRPGHDLRYAMNFEKSRRELAWEPRIGFEGGLKSTIEWYGRNGEWLKMAANPEYDTYFNKQYGSVK